MLENEKKLEKDEEEKKLPFWQYIISKLESHFFSTKNKLGNKSKYRWLSKFLEIVNKYNLNPKLAIFAVAVLLSFFIFRDIADPYLDYRKGKIAQRNLIAKNSIEFVDEITSEKKKQDLVDSVLSVYDFDQLSIFRIKEKIRDAFSNIRKKYPTLIRRKSSVYRKIMKDPSSVEIFNEAKDSFSKDLGIELKDSEFLFFVRIRFSKRFENMLPHIFSTLEEDYIVLSKEVLDSEETRGITVNYLNRPLVEENTEKVLKNFFQIIETKDARGKLAALGKETFLSRQSEDERKALASLSKIISPNLTPNKQETEKRRQLVSEEYKPVMIKINSGDSIIRYGERVTDRHIMVLNYLQEQRRKESSFLQFLFTVILLSILIYSLYIFNQGVSSTYEYKLRDLAIFLAIGIGIILVIKGLQFIVIEAILEKFPQIPIEFYYFIIPIAAGPTIIRMITSRQPAFAFMIVISVVCGILLERDFFFATYVLISSLVATTLSVRIKTRAVIYKMGFITAMVNIVVITCIMAHTRSAASLDLIWNDMGWIFWAGLFSGLLTSAVVVAFVPIIEYFLGYTTDLRLLELASMDHPLLRKLLVRAPGTYHHSMVIGSLVEKAAEDIQANPLLARVMSYYHDVGKMERPLYFIENQAGGVNRHDSLRPHMSAMIIKDHVKKGQELGRRYKLPKPIIDAMSEHHGNSVIAYFYNKARKEAEEPDSVSESEYRYEGQSPQSRESALVMLGDVVEAATRSLADPTPFRLSNVVKKILNKYFVEGHLSECNLTLRDLDQIADSFVQVLVGIYHARIDYGTPITSDKNESKKNETKNKDTASKAGKGQSRNGKQGKVPGVKYISEAIPPSNIKHKDVKKR